MPKQLPILTWVYKDPKTAYGFSGRTHVFSFTTVKNVLKTDSIELTSFLPGINMTQRLFSTEYGAKHAATEYFRKWLYFSGLRQTKNTEIQGAHSEKSDNDESPKEDSGKFWE